MDISENDLNIIVRNMDMDFMKDCDEYQEEYCFVKEIIKKKPVRVRGFLMRLIKLLAGAVFFGIVAALVFVRFLPFWADKDIDADRIVFEEDDPDAAVERNNREALINEDIVAEGEPEEEIHLQNTSEEDTYSLEDYQKLSEEIHQIAKTAMKSMVTVSGIREDEDWFYVDTERVTHASGVIIAENEKDYYILTKYHRMDDVEHVMVTFYNESSAEGSCQMYDANTGLVVLKVAKEALPDGKTADMLVAELGNSYQVQRGESVIAIGSPMGYSNSVVQGQVTSTTSIASAYDMQYNLFVTDILGSEDGSGMMINLSGEVIGVIAQEFAKENHDNVITCLPISQLKSTITALSNGEELPYLGIKGQNVTEAIMKQTGMPKGIYVSEVNSDSPALMAGIQKADILTQYNGKQIDSMYQYSEKLSKAKPGDVITVTVMRKGAEGYVEFQFEVTLGSR